MPLNKDNGENVLEMLVREFILLLYNTIPRGLLLFITYIQSNPYSKTTLGKKTKWSHKTGGP